MVERAKRGVRSNRSLISHRFHAWCCQAAVLVAIAIPVFTTQLEKSREATDASNIRAAFAEVIAEALGQSGTDAAVTRTVTLKQQQDNWQTSPAPELAGKGLVTGGAHVDPTVTNVPKKGGTCTITYTPANGTTAESVTIAFSA